MRSCKGWKEAVAPSLYFQLLFKPVYFSVSTNIQQLVLVDKNRMDANTGFRFPLKRHTYLISPTN